jgi:hypothetical protein
MNFDTGFINWFVKTRTMALVAKRGAFITPKSVGSNPSPATFFLVVGEDANYSIVNPY